MNANTTSLVDIGLTPEQSYTYNFARDSNSHYNAETTAITTALAAAAGHPGPTPSPSTDVTSNPKPDRCSGVGFGVFTPLLGLFF